MLNNFSIILIQFSDIGDIISKLFSCNNFNDVSY